ncbi:MAG TPA: aconitase X, partial [Geminicoccaceae bacterium]|nr:aconitase X [Geminicoccaceae bacterium]
NYQVVLPPVKGEHLAFGDTGSTIYANSVQGARSNFEGGVAALWAALTGRVPRYGFHLDGVRRGTRLFEVTFRPSDLADWGALGGVVGRRMASYWEVPVVTGVEASPTSDELKHFGAALASYGSTPMFHMVGVTPEAPDLATAFANPPPAAEPIARADLDAFYAGFREGEAKVDVVVFAAPQLSLLELQRLADLLDGRRVHPDVALLAASPAEVVRAAERMGIRGRIESAGGRLLEGVCFYQMYAREMGELNGWRRLVTNSAKLTNIIAGYGFEPVLAPTEACIDAAVRGTL